MCTHVRARAALPQRCACLLAVCLLLLLTAGSPSAHADVFGGRLGVSGNEANVLSAFGETDTGDVAPSFLLGGPATGLQAAHGLDFDAVNRTLLVADFIGQNVAVFDVLSRGDVAPLRRFTHAGMGQPRKAVAIPAHGEIAVVSAFFIQYYPLLADGVVAPLRGSSFQPALQDNMSSLVYLPATDEVAVGDYFDAGGGAFAGEVLFFDRSASGTLVPTRRIAGPATGLGSFVAGMDLDPVRGELYVLAANANESASIQVFPATANGDVAPLRSISGPATLLFNAGDIDFDAARDEVLVASGSYNAPAARLLAFPRLASGDAAPVRAISGAATGVVAPDGWYSVISLPLTELFGDGFE